MVRTEFLAAASAATAAVLLEPAARRPMLVSLNGRRTSVADGFIKRGRAMVPAGDALVELFRSMRADFVDDRGAHTVRLTKVTYGPVLRERILVACLDDRHASLTTVTWRSERFDDPSNPPVVTREQVALEVPCELRNGIFYVPLRPFALVAGAYPEWQPQARTVALVHPVPTARELALEARTKARIADFEASASQTAASVRGSLEAAAKNLK